MQICKTGMKFSPKYALIALAVLAVSVIPATAQEAGGEPAADGKTWKEMLSVADSLHREYSFSEAIEWYDLALGAVTDSSSKMEVEEKRLKSQNARSMAGFCSDPAVVARRRFSRKEFFLFYPLGDGSWRAVPNQLDSLGNNPFSTALYFPPDAREIYYSSQDETGVNNIFHTTLKDTVWTAPSLINEEITSTSDEIFPMLSADGKTLYFASSGLYGMGGYDLYSSKWNEDTKDWDVPVNMGFPYSSPFDDFLFINTPDGKYSIFASNRGCPSDSVDVYVVEYDGMPVRKAVTEREDLIALAALSPDGDPSRLDNGSAVSGPGADNPEIREYMVKMNQVRSLRDSIAAYNRALEARRAEYAKSGEEDRPGLLADISRREAVLPVLNDSLNRTAAALQKTEMDFLMKGIVIDPSKIKADASREVVGASSGYAFSKKSPGAPFRLNMLRSTTLRDYTFKILPEGNIVEAPIPEGLVYQIQLLSSAEKIPVRQVKGLSPVFERQGPGGKLIYSAGVFRTYSSALSNLNKVKRLGFRNAFITAFNDRESITVAKARAIESRSKAELYVKIYPPDGSSLPEITLSAIRQQTSKDLVKTSENGAVVFIAGPFADRGQAEALETAVHATGIANTALESRTVQP